ncbi:MAG: hypothetical protein ACYS0G_07500 [Planctomycetota bacterium]|jgi:hypothetical protein
MLPLLAGLLLMQQALSVLGGCAPPPALSNVQAQPPPATRPADPRPAHVEAAPPAETVGDDVTDLLERLERSGHDLRDFQARITYHKWDSVLERREIRAGELLYEVRSVDGSKRFALLFDTLIVGRRRYDRLKHYVFDGSWLVEIDHEARQFIKRQIVPPGQEFDPLKLGEGPFPLPIGQPKDEVLARFEVQSATVPNEGILADLGDVDGLRLIPKPDTAPARDIQTVDLFYDSDTLLPLGVLVTEAKGDRKTVRLRDLRRNQGIDRGKLMIETPDPRQWQIDVRPWREP